MAMVGWLQPHCAAGSQSAYAVSARIKPCRYARRLAWNFTTEKRQRHWRRCGVGNIDVYVNVNVRNVTCDRNVPSLTTGSTWSRSFGSVRPRPFLFCMCIYSYGNEKRMSLMPHANWFCECSRETATCSMFLAESVSELCVLADVKRTLNTTPA